MSSGNASRKPKVSTPRALNDIQNEYNNLCYKAGSLQYQAYVISRDLEETNKQLVAINHEAAARKKLDAETPKKEEVTNVQS